MPSLPSLIETMRYEDGYVRLAGHLARLEASARELAYPWRPERVRAVLDEAAAGRAGPWRMRLLLPPDGRPSLQARLLPPSPPEPVPVALAGEPIDGDDPWRRHKTTHRRAYDTATHEARRRGVADLLFLDAHGFVVEGAVSTVFARMGDAVLTPPLARGALPGVLRAELLARGWAVEHDLPAEALTEADALWIGSSLRGLRRIRLVGDPPGRSLSATGRSLSAR